MNTRETVHKFISENFMYEDRTLDHKSSLSESGILDSMGVMELVAFIEDRFQIKVEDRELIPDHLDSVEKLVTYLGTKGVR